MKDPSGTKQELIKEISALKQRIKELEQSVTDRNRMEEERDRHSRQLAFLHETSVELTAELNMEKLLESIAQRSLDLIGGTTSNVYIYRPKEDLMERVVSVGPTLIPSKTTRRRGEGMVGQTWEKGAPMLINDYHAWPGRTKEADSYPSRALIAVPFRHGAEITGVINIMANLPHQYTQADVDTLVMFATQAAIAMQNAQLYDRIKLELVERKEAEEALRESEAVLKESQLIASLGSYVLDIPTGGWRSSTVLDKVFGIDEAYEHSVEGWSALIHPDDRTMMSEYFRNEVLGKGQTFNKEYRIIRHDNHAEHWVHGLGKLEFDTQACPMKMHGTIQDITDRKLADEALKASEAKHRTLFESSRDAIMTLAPPTWQFTSGNPATVEMFRTNDEATFTALGPWKLSPEFQPDGRPSSDKASEMIQTAMAKGSHFFEWTHRRLGGESFPATVLLTRMEIGGQTLLQATVRDITERNKAEEQLQRTLDSLRSAMNTTIQVMVSTVEARDPYTAGHQLKSANLARAIATEMGLSQGKIEGIRMAGSIHDIGKISIPAEILSKPTKLSELEFSLIKEHALKGSEMLKDVESPWPLAEIVLQHHERLDGSGYPRGLKGEEILVEARILTVADVVEAMASHRPYRPGLGIDAALNEIEKNSGVFYDKAVADACLRLFREKGFKLDGI